MAYTDLLLQVDKNRTFNYGHFLYKLTKTLNFRDRLTRNYVPFAKD